MGRFKSAALAAGVLVVPAVSSAAVDVSASAALIESDGVAAMTAIGTALMAVAVVAVIFKWAKAALFG